jgi:hypothetical protein
MNKTKIKQQFIKWLTMFVAKPNKAFNNLPVCPYALEALQKNKIKFEVVEMQLYDMLMSYKDNWNDKYDIVVFFVDDIYLPHALPSIIETANKYLMPADLVALEDHPDIPEIINKVKVNFGKCTVVFLQRLSKINKASQHLKENTNYYEHWSEENLDDVVNWRFNEHKNTY